MRPVAKLIVFAGAAHALALALVLFPERTIAPGKLSRGHAALSKQCFACHDAFAGAASQKCRSCHRLDARGGMTTVGARTDLGRATPFHHALTKKDCIACHSEHEGMSAYRTKAVFSHDMVEPSMRKQCQTCHDKPDDDLHRKVVAGCDQCHAQTKWTDTHFDHSKYFEFDSHHKPPCATCHTGTDFKSYSCLGCHQRQGGALAAFHKKRGIRNIEDCVSCHRGAHAPARE